MCLGSFFTLPDFLSISTIWVANNSYGVFPPFLLSSFCQLHSIMLHFIVILILCAQVNLIIKYEKMEWTTRTRLASSWLLFSLQIEINESKTFWLIEYLTSHCNGPKTAENATKTLYFVLSAQFTRCTKMHYFTKNFTVKKIHLFASCGK